MRKADDLPGPVVVVVETAADWPAGVVDCRGNRQRVPLYQEEREPSSSLYGRLQQVVGGMVDGKQPPCAIVFACAECGGAAFQARRLAAIGLARQLAGVRLWLVAPRDADDSCRAALLDLTGELMSLAQGTQVLLQFPEPREEEPEETVSGVRILSREALEELTGGGVGSSVAVGAIARTR